MHTETVRFDTCLCTCRADRDNGGGFVAGFVVGGAIFGALGFIFAPQISAALLNDEQRLRLPKFLDEEEKSPEATKQVCKTNFASTIPMHVLIRTVLVLCAPLISNCAFLADRPRSRCAAQIVQISPLCVEGNGGCAGLQSVLKAEIWTVHRVRCPA